MKYRVLNSEGPYCEEYHRTADIGFSTGIIHASGDYLLIKFPEDMYPGILGHDGNGRFHTNEYWWVRPENLVLINDKPFTDREYEDIFV